MCIDQLLLNDHVLVDLVNASLLRVCNLRRVPIKNVSIEIEVAGADDSSHVQFGTIPPGETRTHQFDHRDEMSFVGIAWDGCQNATAMAGGSDVVRVAATTTTAAKQPMDLFEFDF